MSKKRQPKADWHGENRRNGTNKTCVHCQETWEFDDFVCPCCGQAAVDQYSSATPTLRFVFEPEPSKRYDVIRISTGKSVFSEPDNYLSVED